MKKFFSMLLRSTEKSYKEAFGLELLQAWECFANEKFQPRNTIPHLCQIVVDWEVEMIKLVCESFNITVAADCNDPFAMYKLRCLKQMTFAWNTFVMDLIEDKSLPPKIDAVTMYSRIYREWKEKMKQILIPVDSNNIVCYDTSDDVLSDEDFVNK